MVKSTCLAHVELNKVKEVERLKEVEAAVNVQTMEFLEKKRNQLQDEVDAWEERQATTTPETEAEVSSATPRLAVENFALF